ncbi:hypothetical protein HYX14_06720 [Candidatus Woesearchaeota archaeon]|nr:hypothetical protein [Candidatus Woesearchaeota archaeon]
MTAQLEAFVQGVKGVYAAIVPRIEAFIEVLNQGQKDERSTKKIKNFLNRLLAQLEQKRGKIKEKQKLEEIIAQLTSLQAAVIKAGKEASKESITELNVLYKGCLQMFNQLTLSK